MISEDDTTARIAVVGTGYVGLTTGACLSHLGHDVVCLDIDAEKVALLRKGQVPILEDGLERLVVEGIHTAKLDFTTDVVAAITRADFVFLCLPTPQAADGSADLSYVEGACGQIGSHLAPGAVVINKSTVPVGTTRMVTEALRRDDVHVVSNPEFLRQGTAVHDFLNPDRIVIGAHDREVALRVAALYLDLAAPWVVTDPASAELIKYVANSFLATKLSFVNAVAAVSEAVGANVTDVIQGVGHDRRIGHAFLAPGPGWGGSCLPKDTSALAHIAGRAGYEFTLLHAAMEVNEQQFDRVVAKAEELVGDLDGRTVAVWGLTFKAHTDDLRDSPALEIISRMLARGARIRAFDPGIEPSRHVMDGIEVVDGLFEATDGAEVLMVLTEWPEFRRADLAQLEDSLRTLKIVDSRNLMDLGALERHGFEVRSVGRR